VEDTKPAPRDTVFLFENPSLGDNYLLDIQKEIDAHNCSGGPPHTDGNRFDSWDYYKKRDRLYSKLGRAHEIRRILEKKTGCLTAKRMLHTIMYRTEKRLERHIAQ
jgi:hypothetical protein